MIATYQYRIYPTTKQRRQFEENLDACRMLYNQALAQRKECYEKMGKGMTYLKQANQSTPLRVIVQVVYGIGVNMDHLPLPGRATLERSLWFGGSLTLPPERLPLSGHLATKPKKRVAIC